MFYLLEGLGGKNTLNYVRGDSIMNKTGLVCVLLGLGGNCRGSKEIEKRKNEGSRVKKD